MSDESRAAVLGRIENTVGILKLRDGEWMPAAVREAFEKFSDNDLLAIIMKDAASLLVGEP